jgi:hypothetical protein
MDYIAYNTCILLFFILVTVNACNMDMTLGSQLPSGIDSATGTATSITALGHVTSDLGPDD